MHGSLKGGVVLHFLLCRALFVGAQGSLYAKDDVGTTVALDDAGHLSHLRGRSGRLKRLLHLPGPKLAKVTAIAVGTAVAPLRCILLEHLQRGPLSIDLVDVLLQLRLRFLHSDPSGALVGPPRYGIAGLLVLDEEVGALHDRHGGGRGAAAAAQRWREEGLGRWLGQLGSL